MPISMRIWANTSYAHAIYTTGSALQRQLVPATGAVQRHGTERCPQVHLDGCLVHRPQPNQRRQSVLLEDVFPNLTIPTAFTNFPNIEIDELGTNVGPNSSAPQGGTQNVYQGSDTMSFIRGKHTLKAGIEFRRYIVPVIFLPRARGEWDYGSLQSFVNDLVRTAETARCRDKAAASSRRTTARSIGSCRMTSRLPGDWF